MSDPLRIVVADDEADMRDFFEKMLRHLGHKVVAVAENGRELVELCASTDPDLVITDIKMPDIDGIDASVELCRQKPRPIILVSAYHDPELVRRAEADHVMAFLVKPIGRADLPPAIALAMRRFEELQALRQETADLKQALVDRRVIEQAKGILMRIAGVGEKDAFKRLQELAADRNIKLGDAAQSIMVLEKTLRPSDQ